MIEGTLDRNSKRIMVRVAIFLSLLLAGKMVVGVAGAEDTASPRSSVLIGDVAKATGSSTTTMTTTIVEEAPVPVPVVPIRKLTKNSKASKDDAAVSEELEGLLRLLVYETALDLYRSREPSSVDATVGNACTDCVDFFTWGTPLSPNEQDEFCQEVVYQILKLRIGTLAAAERAAILNQYCNELLQCPSTPTMCCQSRGVCLATYGATGPTTGDGIPIGESCIYSDDCAIPPGLEHGVCLYPSYGFPGTCRSGQPGVFCGRTSDCVIPKGLKHPVCRRDKCQR